MLPGQPLPLPEEARDWFIYAAAAKNLYDRYEHTNPALADYFREQAVMWIAEGFKCLALEIDKN